MNRIRSYPAFAGIKYLAALYLLLPAGIIIITFVFGKGYSKVLIFLLAALICMIHIVADNWFLPGAESPKSNLTAYMKTSSKGEHMLRNIVMTDLVFRFCSLALLIWISEEILVYAFTWTDKMSAINTWNMILYLYMAVTIGLLITRFLDSIWITMIIAYLMSFAMLVAVAVSFGNGIWMLPVLVLTDCILSAMAVFFSNYAMKRSRYDKKN